VYSDIKNQAIRLQAELTAHLQTGQTELEAAKVSLSDANSKRDQALIAQATVHFIAAKVQFMVARQIADGSPLLQRLESLPQVGDLAQSRHVAVVGIADMGVAISDAGQELAKLDGQLITPASTSGQQGRTLLTVLDQTNQSLVIVRADFEVAQKAAERVDVNVLPSGQRNAFLKARGTIASALTAVDEFVRLYPILTEVLGGNGVRTYLVLQVNPAELRPGGGFIGSYSVLAADHGTLRVTRSGDAVDFIGMRSSPGGAGYVLPPGPFREWLPNTSWSFIDSNFFPDFPANAKAAEGFAQPYLPRIDGVLSIDFYAVAKMLELTGPLTVPGYRITLNATNFIPTVMQYDLAGDPARKAILSAAAGTLMGRVATLPPEQWPALIGAFNDLAASRHLQAYFNNASVEKEIDRIGWSGVLNPAASKDYMVEVESNLGGTKANYFLTRTFTLELTRRGDLLHHRVTIDLKDDMPFDYRPGEYYSAYVRLYVSASATNTSNNLRPVRYPNPPAPAGTRMIDGWVPLFHGYGHSARIDPLTPSPPVLEYDTPWRPNGRGENQIYWQKQPGTGADAFTVKWNDGSGHFFTASGDLAKDRVITLSAKGVSLRAGQAAQAQLPSLSLG
jgi:hypothetical protein